MKRIQCDYEKNSQNIMMLVTVLKCLPIPSVVDRIDSTQVLWEGSLAFSNKMNIYSYGIYIISYLLICIYL